MRRILLILLAFIQGFSIISCNKDIIEDEEPIIINEAISFSSRIINKHISSGTKTNSKKRNKNIYIWESGSLSVEISHLESSVKGNCKATLVSNVSDLSNAGVMAYHTTGNFVEDPAIGSLPNFRYNQEITKDVNQWIYSPPMYWPENTDERISLFSYSPYANITNGITVCSDTVKGTPYLTYSMSETVEDQPDLLVSLPAHNKIKDNGVVNFQYKHAFACIGFSLQGNGEQIKSIGVKGIQDTGRVSLNGTTIIWSDLSGDAGTHYNVGINYDDGQNYVTATTTKIEASSLINTDGYLMVIPQSLNPNTKLDVTLSDGSYKEVCLGCITSEWIAGEKYIYNIKMSQDSDPEVTANCFIVNPTEGTVTVPIANINTFWGQGGDGAIATYMEANNETGSPSQAAKNHEVTANLITDGTYTVEVVWSDIALTPTFSNQTADSFDVSGLTEAGNVVVGVKKTGVSGYLWSWHLWITDFDPNNTANQISLPNGEVIMDRNLGALSDVAGQVETLGLFYQWGRKDPFLGSGSIKSNSPRVPVIGTINTGSVSSGTLLLCVANPNVIYPANSLNDDVINIGHLTGEYGYNRWGGATNNTTLILAKNNKTIYDPCPDGWRMSWGANWTGFTESTDFDWSSPIRGRTYINNGDNSFFPAPGCLNSSSGSLQTVGSCGHYWSGSPYDYHEAWCLYITVGSYDSSIDRFRSGGFSVRPVKE